VTIDPTIVVALLGTLSAAVGAAAKMIYSDLRRDRDYWRDVAVKAMQHTDKATDVAAVAVQKAEPGA
jgi:hypothetical protein